MAVVDGGHKVLLSVWFLNYIGLTLNSAASSNHIKCCFSFNEKQNCSSFKIQYEQMLVLYNILISITVKTLLILSPIFNSARKNVALSKHNSDINTHK